MLLKHSAISLALILTTAAAACESPFATECPGVLRYGISVEVVDATTGEPAANGASGFVQDGEYRDSLLVIAGRDLASAAPIVTTLGAALSRPGMYDVLVQKAGYRDWTASDVRVKRGACDVETVNLTARLVRLP